MKPADANWNARAAVLRAALLLQTGDAGQARRMLAGINASAVGGDAELSVELVLLQASAAQRLGDTEAAQRYGQSSRAALAALRHPPARLTALAQALSTAEAPATPAVH
jgi:hypothetical protein